MDVYDVATRPVVKAAMEGLSGTVFAYGVTSSGKTHTMHRKRINKAVWGPLNQTIVSGGEDTVLRISDAETGELLKESDAEVDHKNTITLLSKAVDDSHFITGSLGKTAKASVRHENVDSS
ncbi:unnamed protein product [Eruca vesicaria subsp. sativa]|uniref:Kinesin motor domain-containing protein n=1 Tax=Eruca vesicaria subsp. sativa TaxID=29727 RepID=A0ABC8KLH1_ERUVS|nr:unnamed protein product [Eruca vesicaria subsp. sativa]